MANELPPTDRSELRAQHTKRAEYGQRCTEFRASILGELLLHGSLDEGGGWAYYVTSVEDADSAAYTDGRLEVLVLAIVREDAEEQPAREPLADIHLFTNEEIISNNGLISWLTSEFTLDNEDDIQYYLDWAKQGGDVGNGTILDIDEEGLKLRSRRCEYWPGYFPPTGKLELDETVMHPLGHFSLEEDKADAFIFADNIFRIIQDLSPQYTGHTYTAELLL